MVFADVLIALLAGAFVVGTSIIRTNKGLVRKRKLVSAQRLIDEIENAVLDQIQVEPNDLTAHRVAGLIRARRQKELT